MAGAAAPRRVPGRPPLACRVAWLGLVSLGAFATSCSTSTAPVAEPATVPPTTTVAPAGLPTPAAPATVAVPAGDAQLLAALRVAPEVDPGGYDRQAFDFPAGGTDSRGCNTRARVLQRDSTVPAQVASPGCKVLAGRWIDANTGTTHDDPRDVSIDHLVPLKEAYVSGAASWPAPMMVAFGNDVDRVEALKVIGGPGNASKGNNDPAEWKPPLKASWPAYVRSWLAVKVAYDLTADQAEVDALRAMLMTAAPAASTAETTGRTATTGPGGDYYATCAAARAAGKAPLHRGDPGYRPALDGNSDGVACQVGRR